MSSVLNNSTVDEAEAGSDAKPLIEVGLVLAGSFDAIDQEASAGASRQVHERLQALFPEFRWRLMVVERAEIAADSREEPVAFFPQAQAERDLHQWDFVIVLTNADLIGHDKPYTFAAVSRTLDIAVMSTARVDPHAMDADATREVRVQRVTHRLAVLMLRCLGHLNGLDHSDDPNQLMWDAESVDDLDRGEDLTPAQITRMATNLREIADLRLEERSDGGARSHLAFVCQAGIAQRQEIIAGVMEAEPWQFPVRLSRLTTAAVSAMLVLLMTAETWDMAMSQPALSVWGLLLAAIVITTAYVVVRQQLLVRRQDQLMTEQIAVSNITATVTVLCGLLTMLLILYVTSLSLSLLLFPRTLISGWAASIDGPIQFGHHLLLSGVVSALSLSIGALGAAFEDQSYFRHVTFVDEEL
ncbi:MAG: hypothetical protein KDA93_23365 [Planctomycetaceae bacterium]|nr:hypothetical protein [Planctomycetaceae bacterium]